MNKAKLIVIEGACDGIGKTTQYNLLNDYFKSLNMEVYNHHFPSYGKYQAKGVEKYLAGEFGKPSDLSPYFVNGLYAHDRFITWYEELKKEYEDDKVILLDRYTTSSLIYQSALIDDIDEKKQFIDWVCDFEYNKNGIREPDMVIFLKAPFDLVNELRKSRLDNEGIQNDIHEADISFMKKVYDNAIFIANYLNWHIIECSSNGKMKSIEDIHEEIKNIFK